MEGDGPLARIRGGPKRGTTQVPVVETISRERDALRHALKGIDAELRWFRMANGQISRDDMISMIRQSLAHIDGVRELVYADEP